jgi:hypothetical protein
MLQAAENCRKAYNYLKTLVDEKNANQRDFNRLVKRCESLELTIETFTNLNDDSNNSKFFSNLEDQFKKLGEVRRKFTFQEQPNPQEKPSVKITNLLDKLAFHAELLTNRNQYRAELDALEKDIEKCLHLLNVQLVVYSEEQRKRDREQDLHQLEVFLVFTCLNFRISTLLFHCAGK